VLGASVSAVFLDLFEIMCDGRLAWRDVALPIDNGFNCALSIECHRIGNTGHKNFADCSPLMSEDVVFGHKPLTQLRNFGESKRMLHGARELGRRDSTCGIVFCFKSELPYQLRCTSMQLGRSGQGL